MVPLWGERSYHVLTPDDLAAYLEGLPLPEWLCFYHLESAPFDKAFFGSAAYVALFCNSPGDMQGVQNACWGWETLACDFDP
jgi:hypothetical protein